MGVEHERQLVWQAWLRRLTVSILLTKTNAYASPHYRCGL
jgi:hypothetical protein